MTPIEMKSYLESIEEFINDNKNIVTCSWLAKTLGVHSNLSKQLLYTFLENCPKREDLSVTYLIIGQLTNEKDTKMLIVKENDLEKVEKQMSLITSKHIFSLQKSPELIDLNVLYSAQKEEITSSFNGISGIAFKCNKRDIATIEELKHKALPVLLKKPPVNTKKPLPQNNSLVSDTKKPGGTFNLFSKQKPKSVPDKPEECVEKTVIKENEKKEPSKEEKETIPSKIGKKSSNIKTGSIGAFFNKASSKPNPTTNKPSVIEEECKDKALNISKEQSPSKENKPTLNISHEKGTLKRNPQASEVEVKNTDVKSKKSKKVNNTKLKKKAQKKSSEETKKRSRLMVLSDSESNSSEEGNEEVEREPTPEPQPTIIADDEDMDDIICATPEPTKKRKKKLVSKTFMSADGFMETQKVYESFSEEEEEEKMPEKRLKTTQESSPDKTKLTNEKHSNISKITEVQKKKSPPKNIQSPQKTKQQSLMSFFKKK